MQLCGEYHTLKIGRGFRFCTFDWYTVRAVCWIIAGVFMYMRGKSGQRRIRQPLTAAGGDSRESATETKLPFMGKGETSEVRAHSDVWQHTEEVNPVGCKEMNIKGVPPVHRNPLEHIGNNAPR